MKQVMFVTAAAWIGVLLLAQDDGKKEEKDIRFVVEEKLRAYSKAVREAKDETDIIAAVQDIGKIQHPKILPKFAPLLGKYGDSVRMAAATELGKYRGNIKAAQILLNEMKRAQSQNNFKMLAHYTHCFGMTGPKKLIHEVFNYFYHREHEVVLAAVAACAETRTRAVIEPLIRLGKTLAERWDEPPVPGDPPAYVAEYKAKMALIDLILKILAEMSGQKFKNADLYEVWWRQNKNIWKEPKE